MNAPLTTRAAEGLARRAFTVAEIYRMCEAGIIEPDERFELIEGEIVSMSPKSRLHDLVRSSLNELILRRLPAGCCLAISPTAHLSRITFLSPDFVIHRADLGLERITPAEILLAIEVAASSLAYDLGRKAQLCAAAGIGEYWVVDAHAMRATIHLDPAPAGYRRVVVRSARATLKPRAPELRGLELRLSELDV